MQLGHVHALAIGFGILRELLQDPDGFIEWMNCATPYMAEQVNQPVVRHDLE